MLFEVQCLHALQKRGGSDINQQITRQGVVARAVNLAEGEHNGLAVDRVEAGQSTIL